MAKICRTLEVKVKAKLQIFEYFASIVMLLLTLQVTGTAGLALLTVTNWWLLTLFPLVIVSSWLIQLGFVQPRLSVDLEDKWESVTTIIVCPIAEELICRAASSLVLVMAGMTSAIAVTLVSAAVFGLLHWNKGWRSVLAQGILGIYYSIAWLLGGLPIAILMHAGHNLAVRLFEASQ